MNPFLLDIVICPSCLGELRYTKEEVLVCLKCKTGYPAKNGVPDLRAAAALPLKLKSDSLKNNEKVVLKIDCDGDVIESFLEPHTCRLIGRQGQDDSGTKIIGIHGMAPLDEGLKKIVSSYIQKQNKQKAKQLSDRGFERLQDIMLNDLGVSRMHAMIFYDGVNVGVLDLVSRNGTFINGQEVESAYLKSGESLVVGETTIQLI